MMRSILTLILIVIRLVGSSQNDSLLYGENTKLTEGIYMNYEQFRNNNPITRTDIQTTIGKDQLDFFGKLVDQPTVTFQKDGVTNTAETKNAWGFYQNNILHVNYKETFYKVPVFGAICYLVALVEVPVTYPGYYYPGYGMGATSRTREVREFIINFYDGKMEELNLEKVEQLLSRDETLYKEFKSLKRRKQKEQISRFIKKYNEAHPVYFLK